MRTATLIFVGQFLCFPACLRAELIINGGFEMPAISGNFRAFNAPTDEITGWQVIETGSVDLVRASLYPTFEGSQSLDLNGSAPGTISQGFVTVPGTLYEVTFVYANNALVASGSAIVTVVGSEPLLSASIAHAGSTPSDMKYVEFSRRFQADSEQTILQFASTNDGLGGIALDAVSVQTVPEPSAVSMWLAAGLIGGTIAWRRQQRD